MTTVDIVLNSVSGWQQVPITGSKMILSVSSGDSIKVRFGAGSSSSGVLLVPGQTIIVDEDVWVKDNANDGSAVLAVTQ